MADNSNLELWLRVEKTDPNHTKKANVRGNNITSIRPQYQLLNATKEWGSYGGKWGFKDIVLGYELKDLGLVTFKGIFYYPDGEFEIINSIGIYRDNARTKLDDDFAKKIETDSLTKALSKLGYNSDVFMGRFDDIRYIEELNKEFGGEATVTPKNNMDDNKKWLNKFESDKKTLTRDWNRALATIKSKGYDSGIDTLKGIFKISKETLKELKQI